MKNILVFLLTIIVLPLLIVTLVLKFLPYEYIQDKNLIALLDSSGLRKKPFVTSYDPVQAYSGEDSGTQLVQDNFPVVIQNSDDSFSYEKWEKFEFTYGKNADLSNFPNLTFKNAFTELPLVYEDYYYRKFENGAAGAVGINKVGSLKPGDRIALIRDKYINVKSWNGFVQPPGYYFGSGLCWSTSVLGILMDNANAKFKEKYGVALFVFGPGDRAPHPHWYRTYHGRGYTVLQMSEGYAAQDYRFTVNPDIKNMAGLEDLQIKIVMLTTTSHPTAAYGQSIGGYILSNKEF